MKQRLLNSLKTLKMKVNERKWKLFLHRVRLFRFVPFVEFVLAAGSLATGNLHENSDFDVIVGCRKGRVFTTRFFAVVIFGIPGWRRKKLTHGEAASDKICLNHFVTQAAYRLQGPHNRYWQHLYNNLVPVMGEREKIDDFFKANNWMNPKRSYGIKSYKSNPFHLRVNKSYFGHFMENILNRGFGDRAEKVLKNIQVKRIEQSLSSNLGYKPRVVYNDDELEFHPDTKRIQMFVENFKGS